MTKSTLPILDVYKTVSKKEDPREKLEQRQLEALKMQSGLANESLRALQNSPNESVPYLEALGSVRQGFGENPTGWAALGAGITEGLAFAEKKKSILDDKARLEKYTNTLNKLQAYSDEAAGRVAEAQKKEEIKELIAPYMSRTLDLILENAPQERIDLAGADLAKRLGAASGERLEYAMGNGKGLTLTNPETGEDVYVPWERLAAQELQEKVMMANPIYQSQLLRQQQREAQEMALAERNTAAQELRAQASLQKAQSPHTSQQKASLEKSSPEEQERDTYLRLQELLTQGDPTIGAGTRYSQLAGQLIPGWGSGLNAAQQEYQQLLADLKGQRFKKYGYRNEAEFKNIHTLDPSLSREEALTFVQNELAKLGTEEAPRPSSSSTDPHMLQKRLDAINARIEALSQPQ